MFISGYGIAMERACDVAVIGGGPAGLSAALILGRARRTVRLIDDGHQRNRPVRESHGFVGHDGLSPSELIDRSRSQLDRYPTIAFIEDHACHIDGQIDEFNIHLQSGQGISARRVLFATGMYDDLPPIEGLHALWGKRVYVCPYCDAWEFRDQRMAIVGTSHSALGLAQELWNWSRELVICPTSNVPVSHELREWQRAAGVSTSESAPVKMIERDGRVAIECAAGETVDCAVVFVCAPLKQRSDLPASMGCDITERGTIRVDENNRATVPGCFAAGDCITRYHQIVFAASSGARAALAINEEFYEADARALIEALNKPRADAK